MATPTVPRHSIGAPAREARSWRPSRRRPTGGPTASRGSTLLGYLLIAPIVAIMVLVIGVPLVNAVVTSFHDERVIGSPSDFVGLDTYRAVVQDQEFWQALGRSGVWLVVNMVVQTLIAFPTALLLRRNTRWARSARTWVVLPWVVPTVSVVVIWQWMLNSNYGIVHKMFGAVGVDIGAPFGDSAVALFALILVNSWHWFPLCAVVIYGALATVPHEMYEAAALDGANAWRTFWSVTFPLLQPVLFALALVGSLWSFNILDTIYLTTEGGPANASTTIPVYIYETAFGAFRSSHAAAASVLTVLILAVATFLFVRFARPKEH